MIRFFSFLLIALLLAAPRSRASRMRAWLTLALVALVSEPSRHSSIT